MVVNGGIVNKAVKALKPGTLFTTVDLLVMMGTASPATPTRYQIARALAVCPYAENTTPGTRPAVWRRVRIHPKTLLFINGI